MRRGRFLTDAVRGDGCCLEGIFVDGDGFVASVGSVNSDGSVAGTVGLRECGSGGSAYRRGDYHNESASDCSRKLNALDERTV